MSNPQKLQKMRRRMRTFKPRRRGGKRIKKVYVSRGGTRL